MKTFEEKIAERELDRMTYDTALPQDWVDTVLERINLNPVGHVVWVYPQGSIFGYPQAIDIFGDVVLGRLAGAVR